VIVGRVVIQFTAMKMAVLLLGFLIFGCLFIVSEIRTAFGCCSLTVFHLGFSQIVQVADAGRMVANDGGFPG